MKNERSKKMKRFIALAIGTLLLSGCFQEMKAEDVLYEAFENEDSQGLAYKIEKQSEDSSGDLSKMYEWHDGQGKAKRMMTENDDIVFIDYDSEDGLVTKDYENEKIIYKDYFNEDRDVSTDGSPRQHIEELIRHYSDSFDSRVVGKETILDRETLHLQLTVKPEDDIGMINQIDLWFDTQTWVILKEEIKDGDRDFSREAVSFELVDEFPEETFELDNEEGFEEDLFSDLFQQEPVTLSEAIDQFQTDFLILDDSFRFDSGSIRPDPDTKEDFVLDLYFIGDHGEIRVYIENKWNLVEEFGLEQETEVRGQRAYMVDESSLLTFNWQEHGLQYFVDFDRNYSKEEALEILANMKITHK